MTPLRSEPAYDGIARRLELKDRGKATLKFVTEALLALPEEHERIATIVADCPGLDADEREALGDLIEIVRSIPSGQQGWTNQATAIIEKLLQDKLLRFDEVAATLEWTKREGITAHFGMLCDGSNELGVTPRNGIVIGGGSDGFEPIESLQGHSLCDVHEPLLRELTLLWWDARLSAPDYGSPTTENLGLQIDYFESRGQGDRLRDILAEKLEAAVKDPFLMKQFSAAPGLERHFSNEELSTYRFRARMYELFSEQAMPRRLLAETLQTEGFDLRQCDFTQWYADTVKYHVSDEEAAQLPSDTAWLDRFLDDGRMIEEDPEDHDRPPSHEIGMSLEQEISTGLATKRNSPWGEFFFRHLENLGLTDAQQRIANATETSPIEDQFALLVALNTYETGKIIAAKRLCTEDRFTEIAQRAPLTDAIAMVWGSFFSPHPEAVQAAEEHHCYRPQTHAAYTVARSFLDYVRDIPSATPFVELIEGTEGEVSPEHRVILTHSCDIQLCIDVCERNERSDLLGALVTPYIRGVGDDEIFQPSLQQAAEIAPWLALLERGLWELEIPPSGPTRDIWGATEDGAILGILYDQQRKEGESKRFRQLRRVGLQLHHGEEVEEVLPEVREVAFSTLLAGCLTGYELDSAKYLLNHPAYEAYRNADRIRAAVNLAWFVISHPTAYWCEEGERPEVRHRYLLEVAQECEVYLEDNPAARPYLDMVRGSGATISPLQQEILSKTWDTAQIAKCYRAAGRDRDIGQEYARIFGEIWERTTKYLSLSQDLNRLVSFVRDEEVKRSWGEECIRDTLRSAVQSLLGGEKEGTALEKLLVLRMVYHPVLGSYLRGWDGINERECLHALLDDYVKKEKGLTTKPFALRHHGELTVFGHQALLETYMVAELMPDHVDPDRMKRFVAYMLSLGAEFTVRPDFTGAAHSIRREREREGEAFEAPEYFPTPEEALAPDAKAVMLAKLYEHARERGWIDPEQVRTGVGNVIFRGNLIEGERFYPHTDQMLGIVGSSLNDIFPGDGVIGNILTPYRILRSQIDTQREMEVSQ
ncbi:hypothetical protein MRY87_03990 [bacterium]|nr:hypothetical protein [bacterium]